MQRYNKAPSKRTLMALFGTVATTNAYVVDMDPISCLDAGYTYILGANSTDALSPPVHQSQDAVADAVSLVDETTPADEGDTNQVVEETTSTDEGAFEIVDTSTPVADDTTTPVADEETAPTADEETAPTAEEETVPAPEGQTGPPLPQGDTTPAVQEQWGFVPDFSTGICCDEFADRNSNGMRSVDPAGQCNVRCDGNNNAFCIGPDDGINNRFLKEMLNPADALNCPSDGTQISILESDIQVTTQHNFLGDLPNEDAQNWHCKWKLSASDSLAPKGISGTIEERATANGWIVLEVTTTGFSNNAIVVMQPKGKFYDFNFRDPTSDPLLQTYVGLDNFKFEKNVYVFPAEYEMYLDVSPYRSRANDADTGSTNGEGNIAFTAYHTMVNPTPEDADRSWINIEREEYIPIPECVDDNSITDQAGDTCDWYNTHPQDCGQYDSYRFIAQHRCCACQNGECQSTEQVDNSRDGCDWYGENQNACGWFPTPDFDSGKDCCECNGGCYDPPADNAVKFDTQGMSCSWYKIEGNEEFCGAYDTDFFKAGWDCCACRFRGCVDTTEKDSGGDGCDWYAENTAACGYWNTPTFQSENDCCACARIKNRTGRQFAPQQGQ